jgi:K+-transporting ATPase ATPase C chain
MARLASTAFRVLAVMTVLTGLVYPLAVTGAALVLFPDQARGSLVRRGEVVVGSRLIGQAFSAARYFQGRPSATGNDAAAPGPSNLGPTNAELLSQVAARVAAARARYGLSVSATVPGDLVTTSASGLDPHISPEAAFLQVPRIAKTRNISEESVRALVKKRVEGRQLWFLGEPRVNVLLLNLDLDGLELDSDKEGSGP